MSNEVLIRKPEVIQEEIDELHRYLNGIPKELRSRGVFSSYEHRMDKLKKEFVRANLEKCLRITELYGPEGRMPTEENSNP